MDFMTHVEEDQEYSQYDVVCVVLSPHDTTHDPQNQRSP